MSKLYEIVELVNGDFALQNDDIDSEESLVSMRFSAELKNVLQDAKIDLARVMVEAGLEFVAKLAEDRAKGLSSLEQPASSSEVPESVEEGDNTDVTLSRKLSENIDLKNEHSTNDKNQTVRRRKKKNEEVLDENMEEVISHLVH